MLRNRLLALLFILLIGGPACGGGASTSTATPAGTRTAASDSGLNLLIVAEGAVQLKRNEWSEYHSTSFGAALYRGDQLRPEAGARAIVLCDNLTVQTAPEGLPSSLTALCPAPLEPVLVRNGSAIGTTRGGSDPLIPYIISPRSTKILSLTPTLRWNSIPGAKSYSVSILGITTWKATTSDAEIVYPGDPPLQPGKDYLLIVEADTGASSNDENLPDRGFRLLSAEEARPIREAAQKLATLHLTNEAAAYASAQLYAGHGLAAEAIEMLEGWVTHGSRTPAIYQTLGDLYWKIGLLPLAEARYTRAVELAEILGDVERLADSQLGLADVTAEFGRRPEAIEWLEKAKAGYELLGDAARANEMAERIEALK